MRRAVCRVDSGWHIGFGHLSRCLNLARGLKQQGVDVHFVCREHPGANYASLSGFTTHLLPSPFSVAPRDLPHFEWSGVEAQQEAGDVLAICERVDADFVWVDHYGLGVSFESKLNLRDLLVIDDIQRPHCARWILDQNVGADEVTYASLNTWGADAHYLMGSDFALLHPDFSQNRPLQARQIEKIQRVGIFFGGSDLTCETRKVLEAISQTKVCADWQVEVVLGKQHKDRDAIVSLLPPAQLTVHDRIDEMARFIARQDLFFGACGVSALERCCLGVPSFGVVIADNQQVIARNLASSEGLILVGDGRETTAGTWAKVISERIELKLLNEVAIKAHRLCDGRGVERVCREIQL